MLRMNSLQRRRTGFTLIELLVVIGIITVLAAMALGAYFRVVGAQYVKQSETTVRKVAAGLEGQWNATLSDVDNEIQNGRRTAKITMANGNQTTLANMCGGDLDMAAALWRKMRLRQEFPQSFAEVNNGSYATYGIATKPVYTSAIAGASGNSPPTESAILLYLALTQTRRGATFNAADVGGAVATISYGGGAFKVFVDGWGTPICFERWANATANASVSANYLDQNILLTELSQPPYAPAPAGTGFKDTQDPNGKLIGNNSIAAAMQLPTLGTATVPGAWSPNYAWVVYSLGADKAINTADDILSFRLMIAGQKGN